MKTKESVSYPIVGVTGNFLFASRRDVDCIDVSVAAIGPADPGPGSADSGSGFAVGRTPGNLEMVVEGVLVMPELQYQHVRSKFRKVR